MKSTVTYSSNVKEIDKIPSQEIIRLYKDNLHMDVSHYFDGIEFVKILQCQDTGFRFYYPETIFGDADFYGELQKKSFYYNQIHWEHTTAERYIFKTDSVLEVGCGLGYFVDRLNKTGIKAAGIELNPSAIEVCLKKGLDVKNELIDEHAKANPEKYDVVCAFQVLEHVYDIKGFIDGCCHALKKGGKLIFAVPNNNPYYLIYDRMHTLNMPPHHSGLWDKQTFQNLINFFPLKDADVQIEPLYNRNVFIESYLRNNGHKGLLNVFKKIHPGITNRLFIPLRFFIPGKCILAVFTKK